MIFLKRFIKKKNSSVVEIDKKIYYVLALLNKIDIKTLFVVKKIKNSKKFYGTITDGDVRRFLLTKINNNATVADLYKKKSKFFYIDEKNILKKTIKIYETLQINYVPVLDKKHNYLGYVECKDILDFFKHEKKTPQYDLFIMAGGFGKRLRPLTNLIPKPLIELNGSTMISRIIESAQQANINQIFVSLHYKSSIIKKYIKKNYKNKIEFINEKKPLGTAGSLFNLRKKKIKENIMLINSDVTTTVNFDYFFKFHIENKSDFTIGSSSYKVDIPYGVIESHKKKIKNIQEKPALQFQINSGIYFFNKKILRFIKNSAFLNITDLIKFLIKKKYNVLHYPMYEQWIDIGNKEDLEKAKSLVKKI